MYSISRFSRDAHAVPSRRLGTPSFKVKGKFLGRLREDGDLALKVGFDSAEMLMTTNPKTFYITDHYRGYPAMLVRLSRVTRQQLADVLEMAWRANAPKKLLK